MNCDSLLEDIRALRKSDEYQKLTGKSKHIVGYLTAEIEDIVKYEKVSVYRKLKLATLFKITFPEKTTLCVATQYRSGAAHIKCFTKLTESEIQDVIKAIAKACKVVKWDFNQNEKVRFSQQEMDITAKVHETGTP